MVSMAGGLSRGVGVNCPQPLRSTTLMNEHITTPNLKPGDRIELLAMSNDPDPIPAGSLGTVEWTTRLTFEGRDCLQVVVDWDNGRGLSLVVPPDRVRVVG